jgi:hypothetical protein
MRVYVGMTGEANAAIIEAARCSPGITPFRPFLPAPPLELEIEFTNAACADAAELFARHAATLGGALQLHGARRFHVARGDPGLDHPGGLDIGLS